MRNLTLPVCLSLVLLPAAGAAQANFVTNGDFSAGLTGWLGSGNATNPLVENADVTGLGVTPSFGVNAGPTSVVPTPYPPYVLEQSILLVPAVEYEFSADISVTGAASNAGAGICYVEVNGVEIGRINLANYSANKTERNRLCLRFTTTAVGAQPLRVNLARTYTSNSGTPRMNITNISVRIPTGPTFAITDNRRIGASLPFATNGGPGAASAPYAVAVAAAALTPPLQIPGFQGLLGLDPSTMAILLQGTLDTAGKASVTVAVPNLPALLTAATWFQVVTVAGTTIKLGFHHGLAFTVL